MAMSGAASTVFPRFRAGLGALAPEKRCEICEVGDGEQELARLGAGAKRRAGKTGRGAWVFGWLWPRAHRSGGSCRCQRCVKRPGSCQLPASASVQSVDSREMGRSTSGTSVRAAKQQAGLMHNSVINAARWVGRASKTVYIVSDLSRQAMTIRGRQTAATATPLASTGQIPLPWHPAVSAAWSGRKPCILARLTCDAAALRFFQRVY